MVYDLIPDTPEANAFAVIYGVYDSFAEGRPRDMEEVQLPGYSVWDALTPGLRKTREEGKRFHAEDQNVMVARGDLTWSLEPLKVDIHENVAIVLSQLEFSFAPPNPIAMKVRVTDVLLLTDGKWMMLHHHESAEPHSSP